MAWTVASDIATRIRKLREVLGGGEDSPLLQEELGRRAGVRASQVSQWERGAQRPSRSRLERWAEREGWPVTIFQEGAPMPSEVLGDVAREPAKAGAVRDAPASDPSEILARFYEVMADASRRGRPCPPELAVLIQELYGLATSGSPRESDAPEAAPAESGSPDGPGVPGW